MKHYLMILAVLALLFAPAKADLTWNLNQINLDNVLADPRFSSLSGAGQTVAVIDTGVDTQQLGFQSGSGTRVIGGHNFASDSPPNSPNYSDGNSHGTMTAGLVASQALYFTPSGGSQTELRGLAPEADVVSVRALGRTGSGSFTAVDSALQWIVDNRAVYNITVVNMSLGTADTFLDPAELANSTLANSIRAKIVTLRSAGVAVVVASGNSGDSAGLSFPAIVPEVISVGSTGTTDHLSSFSNASALLDMLAPGENIYSTYFNPSQPSTHNLVGSGSGTSFSAQEVAGAVMLICQLFEQRAGRSPTVDEIESLLENTGVPVSFTSGGTTVTKPRMDLYAALNATYAVPEPATIILLVIGGAALITRTRRRRAA
ncbi:MAG: S8 family serine peptidase [Phycisphaerae bacterium]|nr:S8 family serine peptidase [Phycisphaerae bacterium]